MDGLNGTRRYGCVVCAKHNDLCNFCDGLTAGLFIKFLVKTGKEYQELTC